MTATAPGSSAPRWRGRERHLGMGRPPDDRRPLPGMGRGAGAWTNPRVTRLAYTVEEIAALVGRRPVTIQRWLRTGELRGVRRRGVWVIPASAIAEFLGEYDADSERAQRGEPVPADPGRPMGGERDDAERPASFDVRKVEGRGRGGAPGTPPSAGRRGAAGSASGQAWTVPGEVAG
jgi:excisionase family DNA binding protein